MHSSAPPKRIGVMSGGGDCPGLNAVIRAVTKTAISDHGLEVFGIEDGFLGLIENRIRPLSFDDVSNILTLGGTILGSSNKADPANFCVGTDETGKPICRDVSDRVVHHVRSRGLDAIICIGGDGTMTAAAKLADMGLRFVGAPKTIDNDLMGTDVTFGFHTAVDTASEALSRIRTTAASHHRVMLVEMMGRNAGWLTLYAGIASGADLILIPEIPFSLEVVVERCVGRSWKGKAYTLIAVAEGAAPVGGEVVVDRMVHDSPDPVRLGGVSEVLCEQIAGRTHLECRATILGHVQRGGTPNPYDRVLGTQFGHYAVDLVMSGEYNRVVVMQEGKLTSVPLSDVADKQRTVPADHPLIVASRALGTSFGDAAEQ
ncbi:MAG: 6-phosphofructokinase [Planctomycetota bacterium]|jgi:6-phosphofructokinase 1